MIVDTNHRTTAELPNLSEKGVTAILRYYARFTNQKEKRLIRSEAEAIVGAGMFLAVVHQAAGNHASAFSHESGVADATYALNYATKVIGQPQGSAIYFGVDYDAKETDVSRRIVPYFEAVNKILATQYKVGVYGDGVTLQTLLDKDLVSFTWISQSTGFPGTKQFKNSNKWTLFQHLPTHIGGLDVDVDDLNPAFTDFGAFHQLNPVAKATEVAARLTVKARDGLRLRTGPGTAFDVQNLLPAGTPVSVAGRTGDWAAIDLKGDGLIDGFAHAAFLGSDD